VTYLRLDGSVQTEKRFEIVKSFNSDPTIDVLLLTTHGRFEEIPYELEILLLGMLEKLAHIPFCCSWWSGLELDFC
jgi:hypothetical protein